jgi:hypothetical protein
MFVSLRPLVFVSASLLGGCHLTGDTGVGVGKLDDGGGGGGGSEDGTTSASCSPFDTAGWDILIGLDSSVCDAAPPAHDWIRISLWQEEEIPPTTGAMYSFGMADGYGEALLFPGGDLTELTITSANSSELRGQYELTFDDANVVAGSFVTAVCGDTLDCG